MSLYFSREIRGPLGDDADPDTIAHNVQKALEEAASLREWFPMVTWTVPHEWWIINKLWEAGEVSSSAILQAECDYIRGPECAGVVASGQYHAGTGVEREIKAAHEAGKIVVFIDGINDVAYEKIANAIRHLI